MDAVGQLTGGVAHDFNNLLMAILGSLELLRKKLPDDPRLLRLLDNAAMGAQRGASLTQRLLAFSRQQQLDTKPVDVPTLVRGMTDLLERSLGPAARIETRFPHSLNKALVDHNQLELALLNLTVNARDAMPDGGTILISAREQTIADGHETRLLPGKYVCLAVEDTGEGMSDEILARATEPFFTTKGVGKGTGLGLSSVMGMSQQVGGTFILKSRKGEGTRAEIWLPSAGSLDEAGAVPVNLAKEDAPRRALRVLAVDDDALVLFNTAAMLEDLGHIALEASSGAGALEILRRQKVDLIITDQAMPKMTGMQLIETVRESWPGIPVLLATGYAELPGGTACHVTKLNKPFTQEQLAEILTSIGF